MMCRSPFTRGMHSYPCGQCMPCRFNRRREWSHRIMLEASLFSQNAFVTLTYADSSVPQVISTSSGERIGDLRPKHLQDWLKRFRTEIYPSKIRFYAVGEYGDESGRPHYHVAIFNFPPCRSEKTVYSRDGFVRCCEQCKLVSDTWGFGRIDNRTLEIGSAQYVAGYVTKKMTRFDDDRLFGRHPEFVRMSRMPGIGVNFMHEVASALMESGHDETIADVPRALAHGSRELPLGRFLRRKLRTMIGRDEKAPQSTLDEQAAEMRKVYEISRNAASGEEVSPRKIVSALGDQRVLQMEARAKIFKQRKKL